MACAQKDKLPLILPIRKPSFCPCTGLQIYIILRHMLFIFLALLTLDRARHFFYSFLSLSRHYLCRRSKSGPHGGLEW